MFTRAGRRPLRAVTPIRAKVTLEGRSRHATGWAQLVRFSGGEYAWWLRDTTKAGDFGWLVWGVACRFRPRIWTRPSYEMSRWPA